MASDQDFSLLLTALAPFLAAFVAPLVVRFVGRYAGWALGIVPAAIFIYLAGLTGFVSDVRPLTAAYPWADGFEFSFYLDGLSLVFGLLISGIGTFIVIYSGGYLAGHPHLGRFMSFILMFMGSMMGLVMSDSVITLFVFWELTSITSFLLIGFDHARQASRRAAMQALVITGGGGLALLAGLILLGYAAGSWNVSDMLNAPGLFAGDAAGLYLPVLLLVLAGAFTKSAQVPFHFWLPNAMEAPTPVSAYLHSATMVKAGVYLLARLHPALGDTVEWNTILPVFGGVTLLTGSILALRQTDMKQMLAYTTMGSLGMLVMLIGVGTEAAMLGAILFLIAHSFYKGGLFMIAGTLDHETGTRDITRLSGLFAKMPVSGISAILAAVAMAGFLFTVGFYGKEEIYKIITSGNPMDVLVVLVAIVGNALMLVVGMAIAVKPFFGPAIETPLSPHEGPPSLIVGSLVLGILGIGGGLMIVEFGDYFAIPAAQAMLGESIEGHLHSLLDFAYLNWALLTLSAITWGLGLFVFFFLDQTRALLRRVAEVWRWGPDQGFDQAMFGLLRGSARVTHFLHHGRLELYLILIFVLLAAATIGPLYGPPILADLAAFFTGTESQALYPLMWFGLSELTFYEWAIILIALLGLLAVVIGRTRLVAIVSLGIQGFAVALIFMLFGAPDLSFTQFMVETLSVVILALVMTRLHLDQRDSRVLEEVVRDGGIAVLAGLGMTMAILSVLSHPLDLRLSEFFEQTSVAVAHGHNIVNVILVDYRALDTLGEISVVMTAGIAILALIRIRTGGPKRGVGAPKKAGGGGRARKSAPAKKSASTRSKSQAKSGKATA